MGSRRSYSSYNDGCAAAHALDLIGERWTLIVVRELILGPKRFAAWQAGDYPVEAWSVRRSTAGWRDSFHVGPVAS